MKTRLLNEFIIKRMSQERIKLFIGLRIKNNKSLLVKINIVKLDNSKIGIEGNMTDLMQSIIKELRRRNKIHSGGLHI